VKGLIAWSFGLTNSEPNVCNQRLWARVVRILALEDESLCVVSQWEITLALKQAGISPALSVEKHRQGVCLDSNEVMAQAAELFRQLGITQVIPVCQPFLQMRLCWNLVRRSGFQPVRRWIGWIGFCPESKQAWTRGPVRLLAYAIRRRLTSRSGG